MTGIYKRVLGEDFDCLHPELGKKFGVHQKGVYRAVGKGHLEISGGKWWQRPFWQLGAKDHLFFPERGERVPFSIVTEAWRDKGGVERVSWIRRFYFDGVTRAFDAMMHYDPSSGMIIDDLGKSGRVTSSLRLKAEKDGGLSIVSDRTWLNMGRWKIPVPAVFAPQVVVKERFDDEKQAFYVKVKVGSRLFGDLITYEGFAYTTYEEDTGKN
ncbi:DUF4166 domain-containing protein [Bacillus sp. H-16]|uniref:DUF4166 domain-containing protein n=1 Tax=Alteribacter salitolerans TaxID=2912333 RepID=UPI001963D529|nr:DUF4166 domain-containing protein [Alteribacter salitolerans]MBM7097864.1 DUF4166 domain-containing protein [Alteribacter salitolerans]